MAAILSFPGYHTARDAQYSPTSVNRRTSGSPVFIPGNGSNRNSDTQTHPPQFASDCNQESYNAWLLFSTTQSTNIIPDSYSFEFPEASIFARGIEQGNLRNIANSASRTSTSSDALTSVNTSNTNVSTGDLCQTVKCIGKQTFDNSGSGWDAAVEEMTVTSYSTSSFATLNSLCTSSETLEVPLSRDFPVLSNGNLSIIKINQVQTKLSEEDQEILNQLERSSFSPLDLRSSPHKSNAAIYQPRTLDISLSFPSASTVTMFTRTTCSLENGLYPISPSGGASAPFRCTVPEKIQSDNIPMDDINLDLERPSPDSLPPDHALYLQGEDSPPSSLKFGLDFVTPAHLSAAFPPSSKFSSNDGNNRFEKVRKHLPDFEDYRSTKRVRFSDMAPHLQLGSLDPSGLTQELIQMLPEGETFVPQSHIPPCSSAAFSLFDYDNGIELPAVTIPLETMDFASSNSGSDLQSQSSNTEFPKFGLLSSLNLNNFTPFMQDPIPTTFPPSSDLSVYTLTDPELVPESTHFEFERPPLLSLLQPFSDQVLESTSKKQRSRVNVMAIIEDQDEGNPVTERPYLTSGHNYMSIEKDHLSDQKGLNPTATKKRSRDPTALVIRRGTLNSIRDAADIASGTNGREAGRPKERRKKSQYIPDRREAVNEMRNIGACLRCQYTKTQCCPGLICKSCESVSGYTKVWNIPCLRVRITDTELFRIGNSKFGQEISQVRKYNFKSGNDHRRKVIILGRGRPEKVDIWRDNGYTNPPTLEIHVKNFEPEPEEQSSNYETYFHPKKEEEIRISFPNFFTADDPEEVYKAVKAFIRDSFPLFQIDMTSHSDRLVELVFREAIRFDRVHAQQSNHRPNDTTMVRDALYIWIGSRISAEGLSIYTNAKKSSITEFIGVSIVTDEDSPYYKTFPVPPALDHLLDTVTIRYMVNLKNKLLKKMQDKLRKRRTDSWYEIFLTIFVLLHNLELVYHAQYEYKRRHERTVRGKEGKISTLTTNWMTQWEKAAKLLIMHFRISLKGALPFQLNWDDYVVDRILSSELAETMGIIAARPKKENDAISKRKKDDICSVIESAGLDEEAIKFMGNVKNELRKREEEFKHKANQESKGNYNELLIWCSQLFLNDKPSEEKNELGPRSA